MLGELKAEILESLADVRRLVYGLRPPALDDLGLRRALQEQLNRLEQGEANLTVTIDGGDGLDTLPAAVEVAVLPDRLRGGHQRDPPRPGPQLCGQDAPARASSTWRSATTASV